MNSNSTGAFPRGIDRVLSEYWATLRDWRDSAWERWWVAMNEYADSIASFLGAPKGSVVTDINMSSLLGRVVTTLDYPRSRNRIVCSEGDFPTVSFTLRRLERFGAELVVVPLRKDGTFDDDALENAIDERTRLVCCSHASYTTGALVDAERIAARCKKAGALLAIDAYQSVGAVPVDVDRIDADFLLGGAHKWLCGSTESGFLYVRPSLTKTLEPPATGWIASRNPLAFGEVEEFADGARRFATGTPGILPAMMSQVGMSIIASVGMEAVREASLRRTSRILERARGAKLQTLTPLEPNRRGGIVSLSFPGDHKVAAMLVQRGFVCSYRGVLRVAPHFYNTDDEVERFMDALLAARKEVV